MKKSREQYIEHMTFQDEQPMLSELFGTLIGLDDEWIAQGASQSELNMNAFDFDYVEIVQCGGNTSIMSGLSEEILEETPEHIIKRDEFGRRTKLCKGKATIPLPLDYPVKTYDDWLKIKSWFTFDESRVSQELIDKAIVKQKNGALVLAGIPGGFDLPRQLMGEEALFYAFVDEPDLIKDILDTVADTAIKVLDRVSDKVMIDNFCVHEDMAGKSGPLIGGEMILDFLKPYYTRVYEVVKSKGTRLFSQDSDGNMSSVLDAFLECGINISYPCEPAAGMDIVALRKKYGNRLAFKGGIDKHVLREDRNAIIRELEYKLQSSMRSGMVFGLDHRITNGTSIENYRFYVKTRQRNTWIAKGDR